MDADTLWIEELPGQGGEHFHGLSSAHADGARTQPTRVGCVRIRANEQGARDGVLLEHNLVDDARPRGPEAQAVTSRGRAQETIHLSMFLDGVAQVALGCRTRLDEVVAVDGGRHGHSPAPGLHELKQRGLSKDVLQNHPIGPQLQNAVTRLEIRLGVRIVEVSKQELVGERQRLVESVADRGKPRLHLGVGSSDRVGRGFDLEHKANLDMHRTAVQYMFTSVSISGTYEGAGLWSCGICATSSRSLNTATS